MKKKKRKSDLFFNPQYHFLCKCGAIVVKNNECPICKIRRHKNLKLYQVLKKPYIKLLKIDREEIIAHWNVLDSREHRIMGLRYGIGENKIPHSLQEVGNILGLTRQRIHQIQITVLIKISKFKKSNK